MKRELKKLYRKYKRKLKKYKTDSEKKISEYVEKIMEKAKQLYIKMSYINYIGRELLIPFAWIKNKLLDYKEVITETSRYFVDLGLYILMYGVPYCAAVYVISSRFGWDIPFSLGWIFVVGLAWYTAKEEIPRIIRNSIPPRNGMGE